MDGTIQPAAAKLPDPKFLQVASEIHSHLSNIENKLEDVLLALPEEPATDREPQTKVVETFIRILDRVRGLENSISL